MRPARPFRSVLARAPIALLIAGALAAGAGPVLADTQPAGAPSVDIVKVQGTIDPALAGYVRETIAEAERVHATVVLQIDSGGSYGTQAQDLARFVRHATVPVVAWAGPVGAQVQGGALFLFYASSLATMAPGAGIGPARPFDLSMRASREDPATVRRNGLALVALAPGAGASASGVAKLVAGARLPAGPAKADGAVAMVAPDIPTVLEQLDGRTVRTAVGPVALATLNKPGRPVFVRFHEIGLLARLLHAVSTPVAVYVLLVLGVWGLAFELTQPGFGLAGIGGTVFVVLAAYGLTVVPVHWLGIVVLLAGIGLQGLDVVLGRLAWLTAMGTAAFAAGSVWAWWGIAPNADVPLWLIAFMTIAGFLLFGFGFTVALRARERVRSAQIGLVGLVGEVRSDLNPEGGVEVKGALWRARSNNGQIPRGTKVRVRGVDGLILRVEPEPGE